MIYLLGAGILYFIKGRLRDLLSILISLIALVMVWTLPLGEGLTFSFLDFEIILLSVNDVSRLIGLVFAFFALAAIVYSFLLTDKRYSFLTYIYIGSSLTLLFVGDFFSFYIFWELMTISSYFLIFDKTKPITGQTSYYYFTMHMVGAVSLLWGILLQYVNTGSILLTTVEYGLPFFILAVGIKLAFIGLHTWLPQNYANVSFITSVALSAYTTKVGVYGMYRLLGEEFLAYGGVITAIIGVLFALKQTEVRKLLSYHIVSQIGYMIVGIGVRSSLGVAGGILHLVNNVLYKGLLFMVIGTVIYVTDKEDLVDLGGLAKKLPLTSLYGVIASLGIAGFPFLNGHISKLLIKSGTSDPILIWGLFIAGIGTSLSFMKVMYFGFFRDKGNVEIKRKPKRSMLIAMGMVSFVMIIIGIMPQLAEGFFDLGAKSVSYFSLSYIWASLQPILLALIIFKLAHDIIEPHPHPEVDRDFYPRVKGGLDYLANLFSQVQNGDLSRYILWMVATLVIFWIKISI